MSGQRPILLAAGGTGGHMFPAEALARTLLARGRVVRLVTDRRGAGFGDKLPEVTIERIDAAAVAGRGLIDRAQALGALALGYFQARRLMARLKPAAVVGFGGYASAPTMMAATRAGRPSLIHEQNAVLGRANRLVAGRVAAIATSFAETLALGAADRRKIVLTGNPVRPAIVALHRRPYAKPTNKLALFVTGGSQGARIFSDLVPAAIARLDPALRGRIVLTQQCRAEDLERVGAAYGAIGFSAELSPFFADMAERLSRAHLMICRSGASTVAELACAGMPAILIPFARAADDHQTVNARALTQAGAAWAMSEAEATPAALAGKLAELVADPERLARASDAARTQAHPQAAEALADLVEKLAPAHDVAREERAA